MRFLKYIFFIMIVSSCTKPYTPNLKQVNNNYLVVGGIINTGANGVTTITLSRTRNLTDTVTSIPELLAAVSIQGESGTAYLLSQADNNGNYTSGNLNLDVNDQYRLSITTSDGDQFVSDYVAVKQTPPIDSVTWSQPDVDNVMIYVNTHDPTNSSRYYWWEYLETWQYEVPLTTIYGISGNQIFVRDTSNQVTICWQSASSGDLLVGNSVSLSQDRISNQLIETIPNKDIRLDYRYSILVTQYTLSPQAYSYWAVIQNNSENLGTLFDLQPSQLAGNIRSTVNPNEPVVGFVSAAAPRQMRMFIDHSQLGNWEFDPFQNYSCQIATVDQNPNNPYIWTNQDSGFGVWYFITPGTMNIARNQCLDCTLQGGSNQKPAYW